MPYILTAGCLMILKLMIAFTDMLLAKMRSVMDTMVQSKDSCPKVIKEPEMDSLQLQSITSSDSRHSSILEAYNLRRTNFARYAQTKERNPNLKPFYDIATIKKDGNREKSCSLPLEMSSELQALDHSSCGVKSYNKAFPMRKKSEIVLPNFDSYKTEADNEPSSHDKELTQPGSSKTIESQKILTSKDNRKLPTNNKTSPSLKKSLESVTPLSLSQDDNETKRSIEIENEKKFTKYSQTLTPTDSYRAPEDDALAPCFVSSGVQPEEKDSRKNLVQTLKVHKSLPISKDSERKGIKTVFNSQRSLSRLDAVNIKCDPLSSSTFPSTTVARKNTAVRPSDDSELLKVVGNECNDHLNDRLQTDSTGFGYISDVKAISSTSATKQLNNYTFSPVKKDNWSLMVKLMDSEASGKQSRESSPPHIEYDSLDETSTQTSEANPNFDEGYSSQSKYNAVLHRTNLLSTYVPTSDKDKMNSTLENIRPIENDELSLLNRQEFSRDENQLQLPYINMIECLDKHVSENKYLASSKDEHLAEPAKQDEDSDKFQLPQYSCNKVSTNSSLHTATQKEDIFRDNNVSAKDLDTEEKQLNFLDVLSEKLLKQYGKNLLSDENEIPLQESAYFQGIDEQHEFLLDKYTIACKKQMEKNKTMKPNTIKPVSKPLDMDDVKFNDSEIPNEEACWTRICSENEDQFQDSLTDEELDEFGLPIFTELHEYVKNIDKEVPLPYEGINTDVEGSNKKIDAIETKYDFKDVLNSSFDLERRRNETSTPIPEERCDDSSFESSKFSAGSIKEFIEAIDERKSFKASVSLEQDLIVNGNEKDNADNFEDLTVYGSDSADHSSNIGNKDWEECTAELSKHFDECISYLEEIDDSDEMSKYLDEVLSNSYTAESRNISNKNTEKVHDTSTENKFFGIAHSPHSFHQVLASMPKQLDEGLMITMHQSSTMDEGYGLIVSSNSGDLSSGSVYEELGTDDLKNIISIESGLGKVIEAKNYVVNTVATFDDDTANSALVCEEQVFPVIPNNEMCTAFPIAEVDNLESNLISQTPIYESAPVQALSNIQETIEQGVSLGIKGILPDKNTECRIDEESKEMVSLTSNNVCIECTTIVDNCMVTKGLVSSTRSICDDSTVGNNSTNNVESIVKQSCTLSLTEETLNYEDNAKSNTVELKEPMPLHSQNLDGSNVAAVQVYQASDPVSFITSREYTVDQSEVIVEEIAKQVDIPSFIEDVLTSEEITHATSAYEQVFPQSQTADIAETTEVDDDFVFIDITSPQSTICSGTTPIYNTKNNVQEISVHGASTFIIVDALPDQTNKETENLHVSEKPVSPPSTTDYMCNVAETAEVNNCLVFNDLVSQNPVDTESNSVDAVVSKIQEMVQRGDTYEADALGKVEFKMPMSPSLTLHVSNVETTEVNTASEQVAPLIFKQSTTGSNSEDVVKQVTTVFTEKLDGECVNKSNSSGI